MENLEILYYLSGIIVLLIIICIVFVKKIKRLKLTVKGKWEEIDLGLRKRADMVPFLIEIFRKYDAKQEKLIENLIKTRRMTMQKKGKNADRVEAENTLSLEINKLVDLAKVIKPIAKDVIFLEIRKNLNDLEQNLEMKVRRFNNMVREYNKFLKRNFIGLIARIFGFRTEKIFEIEI